MIYDIIIIGGGASGLFAMANLDKNINVKLIEKLPKLARKLILSGGKRCNISSVFDRAELEKAYYNFKLAKPALYSFTSSDIKTWFKKRNLKLKREKDKLFPSTFKSSDVLDAMLKEINTRDINLNEEAIKIRKKEEYIEIETNKRKIKSKHIIVATGGFSYSLLGSCGTFLKNNFEITKIKPALCKIFISDKIAKILSGKSFKDVEISSSDFKSRAEIVFYDSFITGPAALNISGYLQESSAFKIDFAPNIEFEELLSKLRNARDNNEKKSLAKYLQECLKLEKAYLDFLLDILDIKNINLCELSNKKINEICMEIKQKKLIQSKNHPLKSARVTRGGLKSSEINSKNYSLKSNNNIRVIGEALDVDGITGGYNLQFALASAYLVARDLNFKILKTKKV